MEKAEKITIKQAAAIMGKCQQFVRVGLQRGFLPFGTAFKIKNSTHYDYYISPKLFYDYIGRLGNQDQEADEKEAISG